MALDIKDGLGAAATLKTTLDGADHVPHHIVDSSALPSGAATAALQTTGNSILTTIDGKVTACNTGAVVLAAGTAAFGKLAANSGVVIGAVEIAAAQTIGVTGTFWQATQPVSLASVPSHAVTNAGTFAVQVDGAGLTSLQLLDDVVFADDAAFTLTSSKVAMVGAIRDNVLGTLSAAEGDAVPLRVDTNGALWVVGQDIATETTADGIKTATEAMHLSLLTWNAAAVAPKFAKLSSASTGNQALVAAVASKKIRILALHVMATASTNAIYINDGTADLYADSTRKIPLDITGATGPGGFSLPYNPAGWFETAATNRPININLGSANGVVAVATYVEV